MYWIGFEYNYDYLPQSMLDVSAHIPELALSPLTPLHFEVIHSQASNFFLSS